MFVLIQQLLGMSVLSLRTGGVVGTIQKPIINPNNLRVEAWYVLDKFAGENLVLKREDIRDAIDKGYVIDDYDVLSEPDELIRLKEIMDINYDPIGKEVVTTTKRKLGKVYDYALDDESAYIQKLYTAQKFIKSVVGTDSSIDRTQIVEITDRAIIVKDVTVPAMAEQPLPA